jgi:uncharacterized protein (TIGR02145 family)
MNAINTVKCCILAVCLTTSNFAFSQSLKDVKIGTQTWMVPNLNVDKFRNGDLIPEAKSTLQWVEAADEKKPAWCYFNNNPNNEKEYGKLYNWYAVTDPRGLAPMGYHIPSNEEWTTLINLLGGKSEAGGKMKIVGTQYWTPPNSWANNSSGFSGRGGGSRRYGSLTPGGPFNRTLGKYGDWWSRSETYDGNYGFCNGMYYTSPNTGVNQADKGDGYSVRCIKDFYLAGTKLEPEMIRVEGGTFTMGSDSVYQVAKPTHEVTLSNFSISKYEITQSQWTMIMGGDLETLSHPCEKCPVSRVSWARAQEYVRRLSAQTGKQYRLPTEAEWEYAARGGNKSKKFKYSGSNSMDSVGWYDKNSAGKTHPVGLKKANELGIFDMSGNVNEWCIDWLSNYTAEASENPKGPLTYSNETNPEPRKIFRGGGFESYLESCHSSYRLGGNPNSVFSHNFGLRVVLEINMEEINQINEKIRERAVIDYKNKDNTAAKLRVDSIIASGGTIMPFDYFCLAQYCIEISDFENALKHLKIGLDKHPNSDAYSFLRSGYSKIGSNLIHKKNFKSALIYLKEGHDKYPDDLWIQGNLAHAYLLTGKYETAKNIYLENKGKNLKPTLTWVTAVNDDFKEFEETGIYNEHFEEILKLLNN